MPAVAAPSAAGGSGAGFVSGSAVRRALAGDLANDRPLGAAAAGVDDGTAADVDGGSVADVDRASAAGVDGASAAGTEGGAATGVASFRLSSFLRRPGRW